MLVGAAMVFASVVVLLAKRGVLAERAPERHAAPRPVRRPEPALEPVA
jgi:hypothetical protein